MATTGQQTHRYLRLSLAMVVVTLFVSIGVQIGMSKIWLPSISHYFYTSAHNVFVGSLIAASLALVVLAGRTVETVFLEIAAVFAPLIALVPTGASKAILMSLSVQTSATADVCDAHANCIPGTYLSGIRHDVVTYTIVLGIVVVLALVVRGVEGKDDAAAPPTSRAWRIFSMAAGPVVAVAVAVTLNVAAFAPGFDTRFPFNPGLPISIHLAATIAFFGAFTLVPVTNAVRYLVTRRRRNDPQRRLMTEYVELNGELTRIKPWHAVVYIVVPVAMIADIIWLVTIIRADSRGLQVFWGEATALALFAVFWIVQTIQRWANPDQSYLVKERVVQRTAQQTAPPTRASRRAT